MSSRNETICRAATRVSALAVIAGLLVPALPLAAQLRLHRTQQDANVQASPGSVHIQVGTNPPGMIPLSPGGGAAMPGPIHGGFGVRSAIPEPIRPGQPRLRLPPPPPPSATPTPPVDPKPPIIIVPRDRRRDHVIVHQPYFPSYGTSVVVGPPVFVQAAPAPAAEPAEPEPMTNLQLADALLHWDEPERAIGYYQAHLAENPTDAGALRSMGMALIDAGRIPEGVATVMLAHERNPLLARTPVLQDIFGRGEDMRRNLNRVSVHANRVNSASAWLTLAVMMQAEGRTRPAINMVDRAEQVGLGSEIAGALRSALGQN